MVDVSADVLNAVPVATLLDVGDDCLEIMISLSLSSHKMTFLHDLWAGDLFPNSIVS